MFSVGESEEGIKPEPKKEGDNTDEWSRRSFLKFLVALGPALTIGPSKTEASDSKDIPSKKLEGAINKRIEKVGDKYRPIEEQDQSKLRTAVEASLMLAGEFIAREVFAKMGFKGAISFEEFKDDAQKTDTFLRLLFAMPAVILMPIIEEIFFRAVPSEVLAGRKYRGSKEKRWEMGIPVSILFALAHNLEKDKLTDSMKLASFGEKIPLGQFIGGLFFWYLMREKGLSHAVIAHQVQNAEIIGIAEFLYQIFPKKDVGTSVVKGRYGEV